jgi:hypothetical protein
MASKQGRFDVGSSQLELSPQIAISIVIERGDDMCAGDDIVKAP